MSSARMQRRRRTTTVHPPHATRRFPCNDPRTPSRFVTGASSGMRRDHCAGAPTRQDRLADAGDASTRSRQRDQQARGRRPVPLALRTDAAPSTSAHDGSVEALVGEVMRLEGRHRPAGEQRRLRCRPGRRRGKLDRAGPGHLRYQLHGHRADDARRDPAHAAAGRRTHHQHGGSCARLPVPMPCEGALCRPPSTRWRSYSESIAPRP